MSSNELSKNYDPAALEREALQIWNEENLFHAEPADPGDPYCIVIPPPNVTSFLHLGHAFNNTLQDILIRQRRMAGDNAVWIPGTDHAGIATQTVVEKRVLAEEGKRRTEYSREDFVAKIQAWKDEYEQRITEQLKAMGCSCDYERQAFTMDEPRARAVREAFFELFKAGLIYRGKRLVNWDPATQTALADDEVEMEEIDGFFYYLRYPIVEDDASSRGTGFQPVSKGAEHGLQTRATQYVTVATTRPETMLGDTAVGINPKDPRAAALRGKKVRLPIVNRIIPIIEDDYVVMPNPDSDDPRAKYATGFLKVTPAHDPNDYEIAQRHNLSMINVLAPDATISNKHGWSDIGDGEFVLGMDRYEARERIIEWFRANNLLEDVKPYRHSVGHSYRSHVAIEPYLSDQWYLKMTDDRLRGAALRALSSSASDDAAETPSPSPLGEGRGEGSSPAIATQSPLSPTLSPSTGRGRLRFFPARYAKTYQSWLENIRDWCISRQLWWGHRIPVWSWTPSEVLREQMEAYEAQGGDPQHTFMLVKSLKDIASNEGRVDETFSRTTTDDAALDAFGEAAYIFEHACALERQGDTYYFCFTRAGDTQPEDLARAESVLGAGGWVQDPDVLDTWFSSGLWPMSTLGWPDESTINNPQSTLNVWNPTHTLCTAREIITLWVSRMVMFNLFFLDRLPFSEVFVHAMIQDGEGRKMSKSLGNGVDPLDIIESHGADAMRFTLALMATNTQDVRMPVVRDERTGKNTSPKFDIGRNFCNKLWNAAKFALMNIEQIAPEPVDELKWSMADRWIVSRFNRTVEEANKHLRSYRFDHYAKACYDFFWGDFCDWYIEAIKPALRDPNRKGQAATVLAAVLDGSLRLLHPIIPFITEILWERLCAVRAERGLPGRIMGCMNERLIRAAWPLVGDFSQAGEFIWPKIQEIVTTIRNLRNEHKVDVKKPVSVSIRARSADAARMLLSHQSEIELLATCKLKTVSADATAPANAITVRAADCEIYVEDLVDTAAEQQRITKRREELSRLVTQLKGRLANEGYIAKAPPNLVQQTKDQLAQAESELAKL